MNVSLFTSWNTKCGIADYSRYLKDSLEEVGIMVTVVRVAEKKTLPVFIRLGKLLNGGDIAHIQHEYAFFGSKKKQLIYFYFLLKQIKVPTVITLHELMMPRKGRFFEIRKVILFFLQRRLFSRAALLFVHTNLQYKTLLEMGIKEDKVILFPHPIPGMKEQPQSNNHCKALLGISAKNVFTIFGFVCQRKGYELAINAIKDMDDSVLLIAGGDNHNDKSTYFQSLTASIRDLDLQRRVLITGYIPANDIGKVMGATDIVLAPFLDMYGSGSLSLSVAYHKPIIASDIEPMRDLKEQGLGLILFRSGDSNELKSKMLAMIKNENEKTGLMSLTKRYAEKNSYKNSALRLLELYRQLIG